MLSDPIVSVYPPPPPHPHIPSTGGPPMPPSGEGTAVVSLPTADGQVSSVQTVTHPAGKGTKTSHMFILYK